MKALIIIDMQQGSFTAETPRFDTDGVISRINMIAAMYRERGDKVIFIQHDGTREGAFIPGTGEWEILPALVMQPGDIIVSKIANDSFYRSALEKILTGLGIVDLAIMGCATDFCVDTTIRSALSKDYKVTVIKDGHTTADRPGINAEAVIAHHNWVWENMNPTKSKLRVIPFDEFMKA